MNQNAVEKKVYQLEINEVLEHVMPPLQAKELELLEKSILTDGCRDPLVVWNGTIVDGHNRYRICRKHRIPFCITEVDFTNRSEAIAWMIKTQIGRRNLTPFQRCEMVMPFEAELRADAKKRQGKRNDLHGGKYGREATTVDVLADMAGVSHGSLSKAKTIMNIGDAETIRRLRGGEISIHFAFSSLTSKPITTAKTMRKLVPELQSISDTVRKLQKSVSEGDVTTRMILSELEKVAKMIDEAAAQKY